MELLHPLSSPQCALFEDSSLYVLCDLRSKTCCVVDAPNRPLHHACQHKARYIFVLLLLHRPSLEPVSIVISEPSRRQKPEPLLSPRRSPQANFADKQLAESFPSAQLPPSDTTTASSTPPHRDRRPRATRLLISPPGRGRVPPRSFVAKLHDGTRPVSFVVVPKTVIHCDDQKFW